MGKATPGTVIIVLTLAAVVATGLADFTSSSSTQSLVAEVITSDNSFTFTSNGIAVAKQTDAGAATPGPVELAGSTGVIRVNTVAKGNFTYSWDLAENGELNSGTWQVSVWQDGVQVGSSVNLDQGTAEAGAGNEYAKIYADFGASLPAGDTIIELKLVKTA